MKHSIATLLIVTGAATAFTASSVRAALTLALQQVTPGIVAPGSIVPLQVVLQGTRPTTIGGVQFDLSVPSNGSSFSTSTVADGFDETPLNGLLSSAIDGSLVNNPTLAFTTNAGSSDTGILAGTGAVLIGTFYLKLPTGGGSYPLSFTSTELVDFDFNPVTVTTSGLTVATPEPLGLATTALLAIGLLKRRTRTPKAVKMAVFA